jgi:hypothetical protein
MFFLLKKPGRSESHTGQGSGLDFAAHFLPGLFKFGPTKPEARMGGAETGRAARFDSSIYIKRDQQVLVLLFFSF